MSFSETNNDYIEDEDFNINTDILDEGGNFTLPISPSLPISFDLSTYQQNVNTYYKTFNESITLIYPTVPLVFYMDYKPMEIYEHSQKIIAPKQLLNELSTYENLSLPVFIKINGYDRIFGIIDYIDFVDHIYLPSKHFSDLNLQENEEVIFTILKEKPVNATSIKIKPLSEQFYEIKDIKVYLEVWLKKMYLTLAEGEIISLPYQDSAIGLYIDETLPEKMVSIYDIEEVEIDLLPMDEYKNLSNKVETVSQDKPEECSSNNECLDSTNSGLDPNTEFKSFSGDGNKLGSS
jgi:hypothetical protein